MTIGNETSIDVYVPHDDLSVNVYNNTILLNLFVACNSLSAIGSFSVLLTVIMFRTMYHNKLFMQIIINISICDFIISVAGMLGFPSGTTCQFQAGLMFFFSRSGWVWATLLEYNLYSLVFYGKPR